jgi:hypothetical protein
MARPLRRKLFAAAFAAALYPAAASAASDLALKRVMLSTGGVAYLEHEAEVTGDAELALDVPLDQVDDVLKSIVVYDSKGGVGSASLPGRNPLKELFSDLPFGAEALASPAALLNALQGAEIRVGSSHVVTGRLLKVVAETVQAGDRATTARQRVSLLTPSGLQQFILEEADAVSFVDPELQAKVDKALTEIAAHRAKDRRRIVLSTRGNGTRVLRVGYVVPAPLWKATVRLTLPRDQAAPKAHLQGWAVLENMTGQDWKGIELTLLSGNPVTFRQAIYQAYYVTRPEVPVEVAGRVLPPPDSGVVAKQEAPRVQGRAERDRAAMRVAPAPPMMAGAAPGSSGTLAQDMAGNAMFGNAAEEPLQSRQSGTAEAAEGLTQVTFRLPIPVTVAAGQSAIVPILERDVPVERLALFQPEVSAAHPLASLRLKNDGDSGLPPAVLTLYEEAGSSNAYVGDARLSAFPAGESRFVSYAVDEKTKVARDEQRASTLVKAAIAQGVLTLTRTEREATIYKIAAPSAEARRLVIEHRKREGWKLTEPDRAEETASAWRVAVDLKPGETRTVTLALETPVFESIRIAEIDDLRIAAVTANRNIDPAIKQALTELARLRRVASEKQAAEERISADMEALKADQERIRDNMAHVDKDSALRKRYMEKLTAQETQFEGLQASAVKAAEATRAANEAINAFIAKLSV